MSGLVLLRRPSAFLPILMSLAALSAVLTHIALVGTAREADEGTAAHVFQLLMALQVPVVAFFAVNWLPLDPRHALLVLALRLGEALGHGVAVIDSHSEPLFGTPYVQRRVWLAAAPVGDSEIICLAWTPADS